MAFLDQLTANVPQGAKRPEKKSKIPVNTDEDVYRRKIENTSKKCSL